MRSLKKLELIARLLAEGFEKRDLNCGTHRGATARNPVILHDADARQCCAARIVRIGKVITGLVRGHSLAGSTAVNRGRSPYRKPILGMPDRSRRREHPC